MFLYIAFQVQNKKSNLFLGINGFLETQISFTKIADSKSSRVLTKEATFQHRWSNILNIHFPREETHGSFWTLPMSPPSVIYIAQLIHNSQRSYYTIAIEKARHERRCQQMVSKGCIWKPGIQNAGNNNWKGEYSKIQILKGKWRKGTRRRKRTTVYINILLSFTYS